MYEHTVRRGYFGQAPDARTSVARRNACDADSPIVSGPASGRETGQLRAWSGGDGFGETAWFEAEDSIRALDGRQGHVANRCPAGPGTPCAGGVGVAVNYQVGTGTIHRLGERVGTEERADLAALILQRLVKG